MKKSCIKIWWFEKFVVYLQRDRNIIVYVTI